LFIDNDNIHKSCEEINESYDFDAIINECNNYGRIILSKIYLDTTRRDSKQFKSFIRGLETVYAPCYKDQNGEIRKSLTDPMIICDVLKTLYENPHIDTFVIVSGDKDFVPLIRTISQYPIAKRIIVIGVEKTTATLVIEECSRLKPHALFLDYVILHRKNDFITNN
jgi:uncharacterized LabA/DUF88 family protein